MTAVFGGILRDVLIGVLPPAAIASWHSLAPALAAGLLAFRFHKVVDRLKEPVQFFDAAGLGVFAVTGTQLALDHGVNWPMAAVLGMISGIGGGIGLPVDGLHRGLCVTCSRSGTLGCHGVESTQVFD